MEQTYPIENQRGETGEQRRSRLLQLSTLSEIVGGVLVAAVGLALFTVLTEQEFVIVSPLGVWDLSSS